jgi:hypothetical protein
MHATAPPHRSALATESCALLQRMIDARTGVCNQTNTLSHIAGGCVTHACGAKGSCDVSQTVGFRLSIAPHAQHFHLPTVMNAALALVAACRLRGDARHVCIRLDVVAAVVLPRLAAAAPQPHHAARLGPLSVCVCVCECVCVCV